jgi:hypothetical protein
MKKVCYLLICWLVLLVACQPSLAVEEASNTVVTTVARTPSPPSLANVQTNTALTPIPTSTTTAVDESRVSPPPTVTPLALTANNTPTETEAVGIDPALFGPGALVGMEMESSVGVLLDELPDEMHGRVVEALINQPDDLWLTRAERQIELTYNRLHFRDFAYIKAGIDDNKKQLPWPPRDLWQIELTSDPYETEINGNKLVMVDYRFTSTLLSDEASPGRAEPALAQEGGVWNEPFIFPADPTQLLQRTSNACINEGGFPPNSYDSENVATFYDYTCQADDGGQTGCHRTSLPRFSCLEAVDIVIGRVETEMRFERLPWDAALADQVRRAPITQADAPDLDVVAEELSNHRLMYQYFPPDSCALNEACIGDYGWRRLLKFDAVVHNTGAEALHIGEVVAEDPRTNLFEYDACHNHLHYSNYGDFLFGLAPKPNKRAFCVESTGRFSNNEASPLTHDYTCALQGIQAGWVDEYGAGLDCQWIDITDVVTPTAETQILPLTFRSNTNEFLCEGQPVLDENGEQVWAWSGLYNDDGLPIAYPVCDMAENWAVNNEGTAVVIVPPTGSMVTEPCANGEVGPRRNCDFTPMPEASALTCDPGTAVTLRCEIDAPAAQTLRVCESSAVLGTGIACTYEQALTNLILPANDVQEVSFTCPFLRDANEPGGLYSLYTASAFPDDPAQIVNCQLTTDN